RGVQPPAAAGHEISEVGARRPVVALDAVGAAAHDIEVELAVLLAVRAEHQRERADEPPAIEGDEVVDELTGCSVVADDVAAGASAGADVQIAVRSEDNGMGAGQVAAVREVVEESAGTAVVAQDGCVLIGRAEFTAGNVEVVVVRAEDQSLWLVQSLAVL